MTSTPVDAFHCADQVEHQSSPRGMATNRGDVFVSAAHDDDVAEAVEERAALRSPFYSLLNDLLVLAKNLPYLPNLVLPLRPPQPLPGVPQTSNFWDYTLVGLVSVLELPMLAAVIPALVVLPGWAFVIVYGILVGMVLLISQLLWGPVLIPSQTAGIDPNAFPHEQWFFMNGIAGGHSSVQKSVNNIAATFGRPVMGIYNKTEGIIGDLLECIVQRAFGYASYDVRIAYEALRNILLDEEIEKVVVIAHSQGGIIISLALDHLYAIMPAKAMAKLEIYTFGSAAAHFHDPLTHIQPKSGSLILNHAAQTESPQELSRQTTLSKDSQIHAAGAQSSALESPTFLKGRLISYIEHYCNGKDLVPRWGVLYHIQYSTLTTYAGRVFKHDKASGHLFDQHYLEPMLPLAEIDNVHDPELFLNHIVKHDGRERGILSARTIGPGVWNEGGMEGIVRADSGHPQRVRDLSRLWRYVGGKEPEKREKAVSS